MEKKKKTHTPNSSRRKSPRGGGREAKVTRWEGKKKNEREAVGCTCHRKAISLHMMMEKTPHDAKKKDRSGKKKKRLFMELERNRTKK